MKSLPILFSGPMVRAILECRKTQTRRMVKPQPITDADGSIRFPWATFFPGGHVHTWDRNGYGGENWMAQHYPCENKFEQALRRTPYVNACPYGVPGDRLWVKETHQYFKRYGERGELLDYWEERCEGDRPDYIEYFATCKDGEHPDRWRPSIHMHRWAARLTLRVVSRRLERLHDIDHRGCVAEGWPGYVRDDGVNERDVINATGDGDDLAIEWFANLWEQINGPGSWDVNPWVWRIEFRRVEGGE